jgi:hypothetical protein
MYTGGITNALQSLFTQFNGWTTYLLTVAGLGTLTMAILQAVKDMTPARSWFQRWCMRTWMLQQARFAIYKSVSNQPEVDNDETTGPRAKNDETKQDLAAQSLADTAKRQLLLLATNGDASAFFDLEIEKLCGQWNTALQIVIDYPKYYPELFNCMAALATRKDCKNLLKPNVPPQTYPETEHHHDEAEQARRVGLRQAFLDSRIRVMHQIQRAVDSFQITTSFRWKWHLQLASFVVSVGLAMAAEIMLKADTYRVAFVSSLIAGFLAPIARDLLAAVQQLRVK